MVVKMTTLDTETAESLALKYRKVPSLASLPEFIKALPRWGLAYAERKEDGGLNKVPNSVGGRCGSQHFDASADTAITAVPNNPKAIGCGPNIISEKLCVIDLDKCFDGNDLNCFYG